MSYVQLPTRSDTDSNASADPNQLQLNIEALKGGTPATAPTTDIETLAAQVIKASSAKSADYTMLDDDNLSVIRMTTGSSTDKTVTLPTAVDNTDRVITLIKVDTGTKNAILDGEGAETINDNTTINLVTQGDIITVKSNGANWDVLNFNITFETGWINRSDWTNAHIGSSTTKDLDSNVNHNMDTSLLNIYVDLWVSSASDGSGAVLMPINFQPWAGVGSFGIVHSIIDDDNIRVHSGVNGFLTMDDAGGAVTVAAQDWYYKIKAKRIYI